jgi:hypothetical protein
MPEFFKAEVTVLERAARRIRFIFEVDGKKLL